MEGPELGGGGINAEIDHDYVLLNEDVSMYVCRSSDDGNDALG
jgi:hypothetical protein